jgi:hypothetical protein
MTEEKERGLYWDAVYKLEDIIKDGNKSKEEILEELKEDLPD